MTPIEVVREQRDLAARAQDYPRVMKTMHTTGRYDAGNRVVLDAMVHQTAQTLRRAIPFLWSPETVALALASPLPSHTVASPDQLLPFPAMWWRFDGGSPLTIRAQGKAVGWLVMNNGIGPTVEIVAIEPFDNADIPRIGLWFEGVATGGQYPPVGAVDPDEMDAATKLLSLLAFAQSRYVSLKPVHTRSESTRARAARQGITVVEPEVMVVTLRAPIPRKHVPSEPSGRDWTHRWIVRGHHRAQWYPTISAHKVLWIAPHIKGPSDKPLIEQVYAVVR